MRTPSLHRPWPRFAALALAALAGAAAIPAPAGALSFGTNPNVPDFAAVTINGQSQTIHATMNSFTVSLGVIDIGGFNVTVQGDSSAGKSAVFKVYCPNATCGTDSGPAYVTGGATLPADSLTLDTTGGSWTETSGVGGSTPAYTAACNSGCTIDHASAVKIASQASYSIGVLATWTASFAANSLSLAIPTTLRKPTQAGEVYRLDLVWTLGSGP
jgi:hypothetical protein